jgi:tRNA nucleotidyltransferase (CCA-adding enzyme)
VYALATTLFNALCAQSLSYLQQRAKEAMRIPEDVAFDPRNPQQVDKRNGLRRQAAVAVFIPPVFKKNFDWILERNERVKEHAALLFRIYAMTVASWSKTRAKAGDVMLAISDARRELQ